MERTALKVLLRQRHLQEHRAFCREYDRVARSIDRELVGTYPSKATFYRWLAGDLLGLPHPGHCRILETMIPGWRVKAMFEPWRGDERAASTHGHEPARAGVTAIFASRTEFAHDMSPHKLFDNAEHVDAAGISLNLLCQQYPDLRLRALLHRAKVRLLFLDPDGEAIKVRNLEEGYEKGHLSALTKAKSCRHRSSARQT